jgi:hypothetical protein
MAFSVLDSAISSRNADKRIVKAIDELQGSVSEVCNNTLKQRSLSYIKKNSTLISNFNKCKLLFVGFHFYAKCMKLHMTPTTHLTGKSSLRNCNLKSNFLVLSTLN